MEEAPKHHIRIEGEIVAELLDQDEYPSNLDEVAAVSDRQIVLIRRDRHELIGYRFEYFDVADCRAISYERETAWYRVVLATACFAAVVFLLGFLVTGLDDFAAEATPVIIGAIACASFGVRFVTSTHRHVIRFEMPGETLLWRSPTIDFDSKAGAARAVREFATARGILATP